MAPGVADLRLLAAGGNFDALRQTVIEWLHVIQARRGMEDAHHGGVLPAQDAHHLASAPLAGGARQLDLDLVAVHGAAGHGRRNEYILAAAGGIALGQHEAVAVGVQADASARALARAGGRGRSAAARLLRRQRAGGSGGIRRGRQAVGVAQLDQLFLPQQLRQQQAQAVALSAARAQLAQQLLIGRLPPRLPLEQRQNGLGMDHLALI